MTIAVQVNGKMRATITLPRNCEKSKAEEVAMDQEPIKKALDGLTVRKVIVVPDRIVNVVAN